MPAGLADVFAGSLPAPKLTAVLDGPQALLPVMVTTAKGCTGQSGPTGAKAKPRGCPAGRVDSDRPAGTPSPVSQGTGGDGHVPILVGSRVFAFFHHSYPTSVSCVDRATGALCRVTQVARTQCDGCARLGRGHRKQDLRAARVRLGLRPRRRRSASSAGTPQRLNPAAGRSSNGCAPRATSTPRRHSWWLVGSGSPRRPGGCIASTPPPAPSAGSVPTGLADEAPDDSTALTDAVHHGNRVYVAMRGSVACVDVTVPGPCAGWSQPASLPDDADGFDLVNRHAPVTGEADGGAWHAPGRSPAGPTVAGRPSSTTGGPVRSSTTARTPRPRPACAPTSAASSPAWCAGTGPRWQPARASTRTTVSSTDRSTASCCPVRTAPPSTGPASSGWATREWCSPSTRAASRRAPACPRATGPRSTCATNAATDRSVPPPGVSCGCSTPTSPPTQSSCPSPSPCGTATPALSSGSGRWSAAPVSSTCRVLIRPSTRRCSSRHPHAAWTAHPPWPTAPRRGWSSPGTPTRRNCASRRRRPCPATPLTTGELSG